MMIKDFAAGVKEYKTNPDVREFIGFPDKFVAGYRKAQQEDRMIRLLKNEQKRLTWEYGFKTVFANSLVNITLETKE